MSGFSDYKEDSEGNPIFLKTVGDKMLLSFQLKQDINKLDGNEDLYISADDDGGDQYFQIKQTDFGKGMFIIRQTDSENVQHEPMKYRDFLEAYACVTADTKVQLLEEGDYELALYYEVTKDEFIDKVGHYRIISKFSIRNGNCTMFLKDAVTNIDLPNECFAENGFYIYLANSKYLQLNVKKETLSEVEGRLVEDTRFNTVGKEGVIYDEEGIYTITVKNPTTEKEVQKKIYVGTDKRLKAYVKTGYSLEKIDKMLEEGSEIDDNGEIIPVELKETSQPAEEKQKTNVSKIDKKDKKEKKENGEKKGKDIDTIGIVVIVVAVVVLSGFLIYRKKRDKK